MGLVSVYPKIIQGGMGVNISNWSLARDISKLGQQGTVSGVALEIIMVCLLQKGDPGGHLRRALLRFPFPHLSKKVLDAFYVEGGVSKKSLSKHAPVLSIEPSELLISLIICANFAFVWLAKEGHKNPVSINYLEKIAMPHIYAITGAMLAEVDFITMGAGISLQVPGVVDAIAKGKIASYRIPVIGQNITSHTMNFDLAKFFEGKFPSVKKPGFIPIVASNLLVSIFMKKLSSGSIYGFVIEEPTAGGHNAPPRRSVYGPEDEVDYIKVTKTGLPFWIGGSKASPEKLEWALSVGAQGIQAGTIFGLCNQSGMDPDLRKKICQLGFAGKLVVRTDMRISSTGFPFKVAIVDETLSEKDVYDKRPRICNRGALVTLYEKKDGSMGYRCPGEPMNMFVNKGGNAEDAVGRGCICNGLISTAGLNDCKEPSIVTLGDDVSFLPKIMADANSSYGVEDAINYILGKKN